ncbi:MAG: hypothetical protein U1D30_13965 [Planctomycetota bacterium]
MFQSHVSAERRPSVLERQPPPCRPLPLRKMLRVPLGPASRMALVRLHGSLSPETAMMHPFVYNTFLPRFKLSPAELDPIPYVAIARQGISPLPPGRSLGTSG